MHQRFHGLASMANTCRAFSTKHDHKPEAYATLSLNGSSLLRTQQLFECFVIDAVRDRANCLISVDDNVGWKRLDTDFVWHFVIVTKIETSPR